MHDLTKNCGGRGTVNYEMGNLWGGITVLGKSAFVALARLLHSYVCCIRWGRGQRKSSSVSGSGVLPEVTQGSIHGTVMRSTRTVMRELFRPWVSHERRRISRGGENSRDPRVSSCLGETCAVAVHNEEMVTLNAQHVMQFSAALRGGSETMFHH